MVDSKNKKRETKVNSSSQQKKAIGGSLSDDAVGRKKGLSEDRHDGQNGTKERQGRNSVREDTSELDADGGSSVDSSSSEDNSSASSESRTTMDFLKSSILSHPLTWMSSARGLLSSVMNKIVALLSTLGFFWIFLVSVFSVMNMVDEDSTTKESSSSISTHEPSLLIRKAPRVNNISVDEFWSKYSRADKAVPIVIENSSDITFNNTTMWSREWIAKECGDESIWFLKNFHNVRIVNESRLHMAWAGLQVADVRALGINTIKDLLEAQENMEGGAHLYLHDATLKHYCPAAFKYLKSPKYFSRDYAIMKSDPNIVGKVQSKVYPPSLFIGMKGSGSPLHTDTQMTRFWMQQLSGSKLWRLFPPSEYSRLYPVLRQNIDYYPYKFLVDAMNPDFEKFPLLDGALAYEAVLNPGDIMFIPEGWAHQVYNLEDTVAVSLNFVDWDCMDAKVKYTKDLVETMTRYRQTAEVEKMRKELVQWRAFFHPLDHQSYEKGNVPWELFYKSHHYQTEKVPQTVKNFVKKKGKDGIDSYRDEEGNPALHVAASVNFLNVVEYLIEAGKANVNVATLDGVTALDVAKKHKYDALVKLLEKHGARSGEGKA